MELLHLSLTPSITHSLLVMHYLPVLFLLRFLHSPDMDQLFLLPSLLESLRQCLVLSDESTTLEIFYEVGFFER